VTRARGTLAQRISLLTVAVAVITALVAGALTFTLVRQTSERSARQTLAGLADAAQATGESAANAQVGLVRTRRMLNALQVQFANIDQSGRAGGNRLARAALRPDEVTRLLDGTSISAHRTVAGRSVLIEARPTPTGAIALVQPTSDALAGGNQAIRRTLVALLIAAAIAVAPRRRMNWPAAVATSPSNRRARLRSPKWPRR
jgi:two-component system, OmpR family, sensor kinase